MIFQDCHSLVEVDIPNSVTHLGSMVFYNCTSLERVVIPGSILIHNLRHKDTPKALLTEEEVELLTSPLELASYKNAITEAMFKGLPAMLPARRAAVTQNAPAG